MNIERYDYIVNDLFVDYEFVSDGPNNKITKVVSYRPYNANGITYFNLGFGDLDEETGNINDLSTSNNKDTEKILATLAATVMEFTEHFPDMMVHAKGSTASRTRLYQMAIAANWVEIEPIINVYGYKNNKWSPFEKNVNYESFLVKRKKS